MSDNIKDLAIQAVTEVTGITFEEMNSTGKGGRITRKRIHVLCRRIVYVFLKAETAMSLKNIGDVFTNQDHSTVIHALEEHDAGVEWDNGYRKLYQSCLETFFRKIQIMKHIQAHGRLYEEAVKTQAVLKMNLEAVKVYTQTLLAEEIAATCPQF